MVEDGRGIVLPSIDARPVTGRGRSSLGVLRASRLPEYGRYGATAARGPSSSMRYPSG
jgi:hypothetical protein